MVEIKGETKTYAWHTYTKWRCTECGNVHHQLTPPNYCKWCGKMNGISSKKRYRTLGERKTEEGELI